MPKILIIDDEQRLLENLSAYLEDEGYQVECSSTAESGLSKLSVQSPDLIIVDMRLQGVNGETFVKTAHRINSDLRFLIHTGSKNYEVSAELEQFGVNQNNIIYKPITDLSALSAKIEQFL